MGIIKIFFQPNVNISVATAQVTGASQFIIRQMPPGTNPPFIINYNASTVPVLQLALSSKTLSEQQILDLAQNTLRPTMVSVPGAAFPAPYGGKARQVQIDLDPQAMQAHHVSATDVQTAIGNQTQIIPAGNIKIGSYQYVVKLNNAADSIEGLNNLPVKTVDGATVFMRDVAHVRDGSPPQTTIVHVDGGRAVLMHRAEEWRGLDPRCGAGHQGSAAAGQAIAARFPEDQTSSTINRFSSKPRFPAWCAKARWRRR